MLSHEYETMQSLEENYWWYRVLRKLTCQEIAGRIGKSREARILDAGCGTGGFLNAIQKNFPSAKLSGLDISTIALKYAHSRQSKGVFRASVDHIPLGNGSIDFIVSLDVLYHEQVNQEHAMKEFFRVLAPTGRLIMNLPAFRCLRGQHDVAVKNVRRYTPREVRELHARHGFLVERVFCWNVGLFLPILIWRKINKLRNLGDNKTARSDLAVLPSLLNAILFRWVFCEAIISRRTHFSLGTSVFSVAKITERK